MTCFRCELSLKSRLLGGLSFKSSIWERILAENIYLTNSQLDRIVNGGTITIKLSETEYEVVA